jgi:hypothetical protein
MALASLTVENYISRKQTGQRNKAPAGGDNSDIMLTIAVLRAQWENNDENCGN